MADALVGGGPAATAESASDTEKTIAAIAAIVLATREK